MNTNIEDVRIRFHPDGSVRWEPASVDSQGRSRDGMDGAAANAAVQSLQPMIIRAYEHTKPPSRTPEFLRVLPRGETNAMLPVELGPKFSPPMDGVSVRQKVNNARKLEKTLRAGEANIVRVTWADYNAEGAGRYYLSPEDYDTLHEYLGDL